MNRLGATKTVARGNVRQVVHSNIKTIVGYQQDNLLGESGPHGRDGESR